MGITICVFLHKDSTGSKQRGVRHDMEWMGDVQDGEDRGCGKDCLESIKGSLVKWHQRPGNIFMGESSERSNNVQVVGNEFVIEVGKTKEGTNAFDRCGGFPGGYRREFGEIHMNLTLAND